MMRCLWRTYDIRFMNLGYQHSSNEKLAEKLVTYADNDPCRVNIALYEKTLSLCPHYPLFANLRLLEIGCGHGAGIQWISRAHWEIDELFGVDRIVLDVDDKRIVYGDAHDLPFSDNSFDVLLNVESSHLYYDCQRFFNECNRVLKNDGFLCWTDIRYAAQVHETIAQAERANMKLICMEDITAGILNGIIQTASRYDHLLANAPFLMRLFRNSIRTTYCAPGTESYKRLANREKVYLCACWRNDK